MHGQEPRAHWRQAPDSPSSSSSFTPPSTSTCHLLLYPRYMSHPSTPSLLPLPQCVAISKPLLSRHFTDTPSETGDLIAGQEVRGFKFLLRERSHTTLSDLTQERGDCRGGQGGCGVASLARFSLSHHATSSSPSHDQKLRTALE